MDSHAAMNMTFDEIKNKYKKYLRLQALSKNTVQAASNDTFYLWRNESKELFWKKMLSSDFEVTYRAAMIESLSKRTKGDSQKLVSSYMSSARRFRKFLDCDVEEIASLAPAKTKSKKYRDVSGDTITNVTMNEAEALVKGAENYGPENELITRCLQKFPDNTDPDVVAMKIGLIDITNSTHLSQHKSKISMFELSNIIAAISDIDARIEAGDPEVVNEIARSNGKINLFSFASKYCCYHNRNLYGRDDYSILDTVLKEYLPRYFDDITKNQIQKWQDGLDYKSYNDYITRKLDELNITVEHRKRKFDHFVWYKNR